MSLNDPLANVLSHILCEEKLGKKKVAVKPSSKNIKQMLKILKESNYIGEFKETKEGRSGLIEIELIGAINSCGVVKPRFNVKTGDYKKFEKRYLPASGFGILVVTTSKGMMSQEEAVKKNLGGKLLAFVY
jgi:small subunit ribosomal protein S8